MMFLSSALVAALSLISSTESFAPRSLAVRSAAAGPLFVSITDSVVGDGVTMPQGTTVAAVPKVAQRWRKSTKQLATLGPSSGDREMIEKVCFTTTTSTTTATTTTTTTDADDDIRQMRWR